MYGSSVSFCFPSSPDVSLDVVSGNIKDLGKTKLTVSLGTIYTKCVRFVLMLVSQVRTELQDCLTLCQLRTVGVATILVF